MIRTNTRWTMGQHERDALVLLDPDNLPTITTTAGDRYITAIGSRFYIDKEVPRCQALTASGEQCSRAVIVSSHIDSKTGAYMCLQHLRKA